MNPYLRAKRAQFEEIRSEVEAAQAVAVREKRDFTDEENAEVRGKIEKLRALHAEIEDITEEENRAADVAELSAKLDATAEETRGNVPALMPKPERLEQMRQGITSLDGQEQYRAAITLGTHLSIPNIPAPALRVREPRRLAAAAGLSTSTVQGMPVVSFPIFGDADAADVVAEGAAKPEYDDITDGDVTPKKIALWTDFTLETQLTYPAFEGRLRQKLAQQVAKREDLLLLTTLLASGIPTQAASADPMAEQLLTAVATVTNEAGSPNLIVVNPANVGAIFGAGVNGAVPAELTELELQLWGARIYATSAIAAGQAIVGNWPVGSSLLVGMPPTYKVDPFTQMKTNKITVMLEEAVNLLVDEPAAFVSVDLVV